MKNSKIKEIIQLNIKHKKLLLIIAFFLVAIFAIYGTTRIIKYNIDKNEAQDLPEISYESKKVNKDQTSEVIVTFANANGIDRIEDFTGNVIYAHGRMKIAVDYYLKDRTAYNFTVRDKQGRVKQITLNYEIPRKSGNYVLDNGIYANSPDLTGLDTRYTRYAYMSNNKLVVGEWIDKQNPSNWYDYKTSNWANIFIESEGLECYYTWIPRYCYKVDTTNSVSGNERTDVKFINVYDEYIDGQTGDIIEWEQLEAQGYKIPEAFTWENVAIPGYWVSKYQLSELTSYKISFNAIATSKYVSINDVSTTISQGIAKYEYAINGEIVYQGNTPDNYKTQDIEEKEYVATVTIRDSYNQVLASMTKICDSAEVNEPDLTGLDPDNTYYVYWDDNGIEHNDIPISQDEPSDWYDYAERRWANIVIKDNELTTYFVWVPRYQYIYNSTTQRVNTRFIKGTDTTTDVGYKIPESFTWGEGDNKKELTGYWVSKYQLSEK